MAQNLEMIELSRAKGSKLRNDRAEPVKLETIGLVSELLVRCMTTKIVVFFTMIMTEEPTVSAESFLL